MHSIVREKQQHTSNNTWKNKTLFIVARGRPISRTTWAIEL